MKKFLSVLITVTMIFSLVASFRAPTASAAATGATLTSGTTLSATTTLPYYNPLPTFGFSTGLPLTITAGKLFKMGDIITGYLTGIAPVAPTLPWQVILETTGGTPIETVNMAGGSVNFSISTGNVSQDGNYQLRFHSPTNEFTPDILVTGIYIQYNIVFSVSTLQTCGTSQTISGWITRGSGQTVLVAADVYVAYPDHSLAGYAHIPALSSGQFTITFPSDGPDGDTLPDIGKFRVYVRDGYGTAENDAMIYKVLSNVPTVTMTLSTYVSPTIVYKNKADQPVLLQLVNQDGNYVTGATFTVEYNTGTALTYDGDGNPETGEYYFKEISNGFYRFLVDTTSSTPYPYQDIRFVASYTPYGTAITSNTVIISLRDLGVFNPFVDVNADHSLINHPAEGYPYTRFLGQDVYDKLPCTIGNSLIITVDSYLPIDPANWYVYDWDTSVDGPVEWISGDRYLVTGVGKITASFSMTAWERIDQSDTNVIVSTTSHPCGTWTNSANWTPALEDLASTNACCHEYSKTFDICEVASCTYGGITLTGANITDSTTVEVGKKVDKVSVSIDSTGAPADLSCSCPNYVVWMYMVKYIGDGTYIKVDDAFTVDTYAGTAATGSEIWYNPLGTTAAPGTKIDDLPITFEATGIYNAAGIVSNALKFGDCPFNLYGVTFNYPTDTTCKYTLVVKVFGLRRTYDACGAMNVTYPMVVEAIDPITILPATTNLSSTATITEGSLDPDSILAGIYPTIDITDPGFTLGDPIPEFYLNGDEVSGTLSSTDTGYRVQLACPLNDEGTFTIYMYAYNDDCTEMEEVTIEIPVVKPEFTVKLGLMDGSVIDNDGILTEGFAEQVYVDAVDPRGIHDFTTDTNWKLEARAVVNDCGLPTSFVCYYPPTEGCTTPSPITVVGYDNPHIADDPEVEIYFVSYTCADILVTTLKLVPPTVTVDPAEVPFTIPATATHVTFTVTDAHGHGAPGVTVGIFGGDEGPLDFGSNTSTYHWWAYTGVTGSKGGVDWAFVPPYSGKYYISAYVDSGCDWPCSWTGINTSATLEAKYQAPVVDTTAPVVEASAPAEVTSPMVKVTGKVSDNVGVVSLWIGAMKVDFAPDGTFSAKVEVAEGANTIKVVAFDAAGNMGDKTLTVTYAVPKVTVVKVQIGSDIMTVNGNAVQIDAPAEIKNGRTFLPLRAISEALGATVDWIAETQGITVTLGENTIGLQIGNTSAVVNGTVMTLDAAPYIKNSRTMVPFRVIAEGLGATVEWDPALRIVTVTLAQ